MLSEIISLLERAGMICVKNRKSKKLRMGWGS